MTYALNEVEGLSKRAARGAGLSWGLAEEAAKAVRWLASHDLPSLAPFAELLAENDTKSYADVAPKSRDGRWVAHGGVLCPLACGAALCDRAVDIGAGNGIEMEAISHPVLLAPFAAFVAKRVGKIVALYWHDLTVYTDGSQLWVEGEKAALEIGAAQGVTCFLAELQTGKPYVGQARCMEDPQNWDMLSRFAQRTYAPATEQSRNLGAGAGNSDND